MCEPVYELANQILLNARIVIQPHLREQIYLAQCAGLCILFEFSLLNNVFLKRGFHDLVTLPSKPPIISYGPPGRSAVTGHVATVFGCTGFLGKYLVAKLGRFHVLLQSIWGN